MFFLFIFCFSNCKEHILWVSNDGNDTYDGSYEYPLNSSNFANIRSKISQTSDDVDEASIIFKEGTYFSDGFAIMGWDYPKSRVRRLNIKGEDGKKVIIHGGEKIVNWTKSTIYKNLWTTFYPKQFDQLFVNEERAMPSRAPDKWSYSRLLGYEVFEDPEDPNYYLRYFIVQQDCTDLLQILTTEELQNVTLVVHHAWYCDRISILRIDVENHMIISRALKSEEIPSNQFGCIGVDNYYYLEGSHLFLTEPGDFYHHPNGTLYYYPRSNQDMNHAECYIPITNTLFDFNAVPNLTISNLNLYYSNLHAFGGMNFENLKITNCTFQHCYSGFYYQMSNDSIVENCLIQDTSRDGCGFGGARNCGVNNCIIRKIGQYSPHGFGINFWSDCNNTYITNCDISDGFSSLIFFGNSVEYNLTLTHNVLIENNHLHHSGYGITDDIAAVFYGRHPKGVTFNHNLIHDFYTDNYCGNGLYPDTGSSGSISTNNLIYNLSHSAFNLNYGIRHSIYNNIFAFCRTGVSYGSSLDNEQTFDIKRNIFFLDRVQSYPIEGPFLNENSVNQLDYNLYWNYYNYDLTWIGKNFSEWKLLSYDTNSFILDPLFNDPYNGDFNFKSLENIQKIGFQPFNYSFGVITNEFKEIVKNYNYHDPIESLQRPPLIGEESFERTTESAFYKRIDKPSEAEITNERSYSGEHSLKLTNNDDTCRTIQFVPRFINGTATFSFMLYIIDNADIIYELLGLGPWIFINNGHFLVNGNVVANYTANEWVKIEFEVNINPEKFTEFYILRINDMETIVNNTNEEFVSLDYIKLSSCKKGVIYMDDVKSYIDTPNIPFFKNQIVETYDNDDGGLSGGIIAAIVIVVCIVVIIVVMVSIYLKKRNDE